MCFIQYITCNLWYCWETPAICSSRWYLNAKCLQQHFVCKYRYEEDVDAKMLVYFFTSLTSNKNNVTYGSAYIVLVLDGCTCIAYLWWSVFAIRSYGSRKIQWTCKKLRGFRFISCTCVSAQPYHNNLGTLCFYRGAVTDNVSPRPLVFVSKQVTLSVHLKCIVIFVTFI